MEWAKGRIGLIGDDEFVEVAKNNFFYKQFFSTPRELLQVSGAGRD